MEHVPTCFDLLYHSLLVYFWKACRLPRAASGSILHGRATNNINYFYLYGCDGVFAIAASLGLTKSIVVGGAFQLCLVMRCSDVYEV